MKKNRVGIFGGAFNPIHYGHLFIAKESLRVFSLDKIIFVPTGNPAFRKEDLLDKYTRAKLVDLAISDETNFELSLYEVEKESVSYFIETVQYFESQYPDYEFFMILGEDSFLQFHLWKNPEEILRKIKMIVAKRFEGDFINSRQYVKLHFEEFKEKIFFMNHPLFPISSTLIRERIYEEKFISYLVPERIERMIINNGYYRKNRARS
jgi:nicotinate-nucleotide adenylyltransferase